jgi:DNA-binding transcriptional MocR family regulator
MSQEQLQMPDALYERIAHRFESGIRSGAIRAGDKLPSVRTLSRAEGVSMTTVVAAFRLLEQRGLVQARPQSGYFAQRPAPERALPSSRAAAQARPVAVSDIVAELLDQAAPADAFPLGEAIPSPALLPLKPLARSLARLARSDADALLGRMSNAGLPALRQAIAARMARAGCEVHPDEIIITSGTSESVSLALRVLTQPGDLVAIESPAYYGHLLTAEACGLRAVEIETHPQTGLSVDAFEAACRRKPPKALLVSGNVQNPTGACMPEHEKKRLLAVAARYGVRVVEDDIFGEYARYSGTGCASIKAHDEDGIVIYCSSFSKVISPGLRIGWIVAGDRRDEVMRARMGQSWGCPPLTQAALARMLREASFENHLRRLVRTADQTRMRALDYIGQHFPSGTRVARPAYGFLIWLQLPDGLDALDYYRAALKQRVTVMPGLVFSASGGFKDFIRLNVGHPWSDELAAALQRLAGLAGKGG